MPGTMASSASVSPPAASCWPDCRHFPAFISKFAMLSANGDRLDRHHAGSGSLGIDRARLLSGLAALISMTRNGIRTFWGSIEGAVPRVLVVELIPVMLLLSLTLALTILAGPAMTLMDTTSGHSLILRPMSMRSVMPLSWRAWHRRMQRMREVCHDALSATEPVAARHVAAAQRFLHLGI